jgi:hypothetical protein
VGLTTYILDLEKSYLQHRVILGRRRGHRSQMLWVREIDRAGDAN